MFSILVSEDPKSFPSSKTATDVCTANQPDIEIVQESNSQCTATNYKSETRPCQFPFTLSNGKTYNSCTTDEDSDDKYWCSTKVDDKGKHVKGYWGYCDENCSLTTSFNSSNNDLLDLYYIRTNFDETFKSVVDFFKSMNHFTQEFMREVWNEGDNIVFSPFSLYSAIGLLLAGVTPGSTTQKELLSKRNSNIIIIPFVYFFAFHYRYSWKVQKLGRYGK